MYKSCFVEHRTIPLGEWARYLPWRTNNMRQLFRICIGIAFAITVPTKSWSAEQMAIAKSTFIHRIQSEAGEIDARYFAYIPAGTRLMLFDVQKSYHGNTRRLVLTESGIWGYVKQRFYWDKTGIDDFRRNKKNVFINRQRETLIDISEDLQFRIIFTRGEVYPLVEESEGGFKIELRKSGKLRGAIEESIIPIVTIPREYAVLVDFDAPLTRGTIREFKTSIVDGIKGIRKPCGTEQAQASRVATGGEAGFDLSEFFSWLAVKGNIEASTENNKLEQFSTDKNVSRSYYTRRGQVGVYKITRIQGCAGGDLHLEYIYTNPDVDEITVNEEWAKSVNLDTDSRTGQVLVTCPAQYFKFEDELQARGFRLDEIPFLISNVARFKNLGVTCQRS